MPAKTNWAEALQPLLKKYRGRHHPLDYKNNYELLVAVILSAQSSDKLINDISPKFFNAFPDMASLARADEETLHPFISKVLGFQRKAKWLTDLAQKIKTDKNIPLTMEELTALPGIGRKSANVIMRGAGVPAVGVICDLHVIRVAPRLGIASGTDPKKIEKQIMDAIPQKDWGEIGMAISFHGREICRPKPLCPECIVNKSCAYYNKALAK